MHMIRKSVYSFHIFLQICWSAIQCHYL